MRFIIDAQLPPALARVLSSHGHHAEHVGDVGMQDAEDSPIWSYALEHDAIVVTKDEDFPHRLSQKPQKASVVVWLRIGNTSRRPLLQWFEPLILKIKNQIKNCLTLSGSLIERDIEIENVFVLENGIERKIWSKAEGLIE